MKKMRFLLPLVSSLLILGCTNKNLQSNNDTINSNYTNSSNGINYDIDASDLISLDGEANSYDNTISNEVIIETPDSFDELTDGSITKEGKYYLKGEYNTFQINAPKGSKVYVYLDGADFSSTTGIAFGSSKQITLYLVLLNNTINTVTNDFLDTNAFHVKGDVYISGEGTLSVNSKQKNAIKVSKDLYISGQVTINAEASNHAISARSVITNGATINVKTTGKDGIQCECDGVTEFTKEQGYVYLVDTTFTADVYGDGIQASTYAYISGGTYDITTHGEFVNYTSNNVTEYDLETDDFKFVKTGDSFKRVAKDEIRSLSSSYYALKQSSKGIKVGAIKYENSDGDEEEVTTGEYDLTIAHNANITINSTDDCLHTNYGNVNITYSNLYLDTYDDGIHADYNLNVNNSYIRINSSYEGLEGANVIIDGDKTNIVSISSDDGINAASDFSTTNNIYIRNGYIRVFASGDGLDANTALYLQGGTIIVEGPGSGNGSLDADKIYFQGGIVLSLSNNGMTEQMSATQNTFLYQSNTINANSKLSVVDENNNELFSYTLKKSANQIIFSSPDLLLNKSYKINVNDVQVGTVTMSSSLTRVGSSQGSFPSGGPNQGGFPGGR